MRRRIEDEKRRIGRGIKMRKIGQRRSQGGRKEDRLIYVAIINIGYDLLQSRLHRINGSMTMIINYNDDEKDIEDEYNDNNG